EDPGTAFFGFLARIAEGAATKRDLGDAIAIPGALLDELHAAVDLLLRRAQQSGAVRADVTTPELLVLLKGMLAAINDASARAAVPATVPERLFAILSDGLRPHGP
ncbi:MAG: hypothetical protein ACM3ML_30505, partial [Micromonosporaceae bacterium]